MAFEQEIKTPMENADFINRPIIEHRDEDEDEALSLSDLPTIDDTENVAIAARNESPKSMDSLEDFNFCSSGRDSSIFNDSELCTADEVFFQGQILPMMHRHSVSSEKSYNFQFRKSISNNNKSISNVDSVDQCSLSGFTSSRSSSISSRYSLSSSLNSTTSSASLTAAATTATVKTRVPKTRVLNQFQFSHPSPKPQIKPSSYNVKYPNHHPSNQNSRSTMWSIFRVGLVTTREIDIQELKSRSSNSNRNSNNNGEKRRKKSMFNKKGGGLFGDCKCSAVGTVESRIGVMKRSQSVKEEQQGGGIKQSLSRHRTFEWLKQLSLDAIDDL